MPRTRPKPRTAPRRTVAYVRASTEDQHLTVKAQEERIRAYCFATGRDLHTVVRDPGVSGKTLQRPGIQALRRDLASGDVGTVVITKLDRLTRSVRDLADLLDVFKAADATLVSVSESLDTGSASGRMAVNMLGTVAQWEREVIAERTSEVLAFKRKQGRVYGSTPYGYRRSGDLLLPVAREQRALTLMRSLFAQELPYRTIAAHLAAQGFKPRGACWHANTVRRILHTRMARDAA